MQFWSVCLQLGRLLCPITVSKEAFVTLMRSELLEKRALSKRITFLARIIQWGLGPGRVVINQQISGRYSFWTDRWKQIKKKLFFYNGHNFNSFFISLLLFKIHGCEAVNMTVICHVSFYCHPVNSTSTFANLSPSSHDCYPSAGAVISIQWFPYIKSSLTCY